MVSSNSFLRGFDFGQIHTVWDKLSLWGPKMVIFLNRSIRKSVYSYPRYIGWLGPFVKGSERWQVSWWFCVNKGNLSHWHLETDGHTDNQIQKTTMIFRQKRQIDWKILEITGILKKVRTHWGLLTHECEKFYHQTSADWTHWPLGDVAVIL